MTRRPDDQFPMVMTLKQTAEYVGIDKDEILADIRKAINPLPAKQPNRRWRIHKQDAYEYYRD